MLEFRDGPIQGVIVTPIRKFADERGWLAEVFRHDQLEADYHPAMCYVSVTLPGVLRGPHEHADQADLFSWMGPGEFLVTLWDNRPDSPTYLNRMELTLGAGNPGSLLVPRGVVHCYRCTSEEPGLVLNSPNRLFKGPGRTFPVDEIRHEADPANPFVLDEAARRNAAP
ncbi:dTDP-4-dehydrorhamnose 3,5-epimerase family protein [Mesoterricola silvestris]|uniref:dTDP-4-dehydrorhamnose 3,5-epimerase n=1 Tax=Mesoterricola silvestris TaxID=2927979 RepID=A0AA48GJV6_9BACT|nr:dTDP-4-dehydrorhamnose 3,5-epimerase family protein [Mesoterricola silvestris]BDU71084.1 dTDP-4-dehydrorhamnose 3,5-epimerase [Mesoterricola silvestris]